MLVWQSKSNGQVFLFFVNQQTSFLFVKSVWLKIVSFFSLSVGLGLMKVFSSPISHIFFLSSILNELDFFSKRIELLFSVCWSTFSGQIVGMPQWAISIEFMFKSVRSRFVFKWQKSSNYEYVMDFFTPYSLREDDIVKNSWNTTSWKLAKII